MTGKTGITRIARINRMTGLQGLYPVLIKKIPAFFKNTNERLKSVFFSSSTT